MSDQTSAPRLTDIPVASLTGRSCWILSDGKTGHEAQCLGVAEALDLNIEIKRVAPSGMHRALSPFLPVARSEQFGGDNNQFRPPWPDVAISAGRLTAPYMRALKRHAGQSTFALMLLDPGIGTSKMDMVWVPRHDEKTGSNVFSTLTPPHRHSPSSMVLLRQTLPPFECRESKTKFVVLLGGPNGRHKYTDAAIARLTSGLQSLVGLGATLLVTASRRTPPALADAVKPIVASCGGYFWDGTGDNPIAHFYAHGEVFIVPADSINMTAEPCVTGRPVYVFHPDGGSEKFSRFHAALEAYGATRPMPASFTAYDTWSYAPLFASDSIAEEVLRRWSYSVSPVDAPGSH